MLYRLSPKSWLIAAATFVAPQIALACDTALLLAIDVSSSIDPGEYRLQVDGMADALLDPEISDALVSGQVALAVVQWSGVGDQAVSMPWARMNTGLDVIAFAANARNMPREYVDSDTALGDAIVYSLRQFADVPDCHRQIIDMSGDGPENSGSPSRHARQRAERSGVIINGIAIESMGLAITSFFKRSVITRHGFVITAIGHLDYARAIREKIKREVTRVTG